MKIIVKPDAYFFCALVLLLLPLQWIPAILLSSAIHELFHYVALRLCGEQVYALTIGAGGAVMDTTGLSNRKGIICTLAGPASCMFVLLFYRWFPRTCLCSVIHSLYNLLPVFPLDGGRAMRCLAQGLSGHPGLAVLIENTTLVLIALSAVYAACILELGVLPLLFACMMVVKAKKNSLQTERREGTIVLP